jgi:hypothetical protein
MIFELRPDMRMHLRLLFRRTFHRDYKIPTERGFFISQERRASDLLSIR